MTFEQFKKMVYYTRLYIRIPGSRSSIDKSRLINKKGKFDFEKQDKILRQVYEDENYANR